MANTAANTASIVHFILPKGLKVLVVEMIDEGVIGVVMGQIRLSAWNRRRQRKGNGVGLSASIQCRYIGLGPPTGIWIGFLRLRRSRLKRLRRLNGLSRLNWLSRRSRLRLP